MFSLTDVCNWTGGKLIDEKGTIEIEPVFTSVSTDTRTLLPGALFVAIKGENFDGHKFLKDAENAGALTCIVEEHHHNVIVPQVVVKDSVRALQDIAKGYREKLNIPVIAITGSNGKTTTKNYIASILMKKYRVAYTRGSLNNHIGLPLSVLSIKRDDEIAVFEIGTNHKGEIKTLVDICKPTIGVVTNIGVAHIENFGSKEEIAKEKAVLVSSLPEDSFVVIPKSEEYINIFKENTKARIVEVSEERVALKAGIRAVHLVADATLAAAVGKELGVKEDEIIDALSNTKGEDGRFTIKQWGQFEVIDDTYNGNPDSVCAAIEGMIKIYPDRRKIIALGKLMEQGDFLNEGYERIIEKAKDMTIIFVDIAYDSSSVMHVKNQKECAEAIKNMYKLGDVVLLKGSKSAEMKKVLDFLK